MADRVLLWRIATDAPNYQADDVTGRGAELEGGRWNRIGTPMLYASSSRALACLETLAHFGGSSSLPLNRYLVEFQVPTSVWDARTRFDAPAHVGWDAEPPGQVSLDWGTEWARSLASAIAEVPSVIVPDERNFLLNPFAPGFDRIAVRKVQRWHYDPRLRSMGH